MELNEYQEKAMGTCLPESKNMLYMMWNLIAECVEACEKIEDALEGTDCHYRPFTEIISICKKYGLRAKELRKGDAELTKAAEAIDKALHDHITPEQANALHKELGDILWQLSGACSVMGWQLGNVAWQNILKLADRKKRNVIDGDGDNR